MFLDEVLKEKKKLVKDWKSAVPLSEIKKRVHNIEKRPFYKTFSERNPKEVKIIAELKKASPSRGLLKADFDPVKIVKDYEVGGARAISVITEEKYFQGSLDFIPLCKKNTSLPILRKDFIVDEYEIYQAKTYGADAVLLIGEALGKTQIQEYLEAAKEADVDVLLEIHNMKTYEKLSDLSGFVLGINNRDLKTLKIDLDVSREMIRNIPPDLPVIAESGIEERRQIEDFMDLGFSGFLIGTSLMMAISPAEKLKELRGA
jgi:indole-3-glycerol phosphate synthase